MKVWVISFANSGNFGDRLGVHLLSGLLPPEAVVRHVFHQPWDAPADDSPDMLVLGIGNSVFAPLLTPDLLGLVERAPRVVGIFGTQYHEAMPRAPLARLLGSMDAWFARSKDDLERYGAMARNPHYLGDWLIDAFPMAEPRTDEWLRLPAKPTDQKMALDRYISLIQHYGRVHSPRLHPLLCALTSAREVSYSEQPAHLGDRTIYSGKFAAMLSDVFGKAYPPDEPFAVDRDSVASYKAAVRRNLAQVRAALSGERLNTDPVATDADPG